MFGTILQAILAALGLANKVAETVQDDQQQKAGAAEQKSADQSKILTEITEAKDVQNNVAGDSDADINVGVQQWTRK